MLKLLYTRPRPDPKLKAYLEAQGGCFYHLPTLMLTPTRSPAELKAIAKTITPDTLCLFVSPTAIDLMGPMLKQYCPYWSRLRYICMGPGSREALLALSILPQQIHSAPPPYNSEALLSLPWFDNLTRLQSHPCLFFQGQTGRTLLFDTLSGAGISVRTILLYQRHKPTLTPQAQAFWQSHLPQVNTVLVSSASGLTNLLDMVAMLDIPTNPLRTYLQQQILWVPSTRVADLAKTFGFLHTEKVPGLKADELISHGWSIV